MDFNFATVTEALADRLPDHVVIVAGERRVTPDARERRSARLAGGLAANGVGAGEKAGIVLHNEVRRTAVGKPDSGWARAAAGEQTS